MRYTDKSKTERDAIRQQQLGSEANDILQESQGQIATDYLLATTPDEQTVDVYRESSSGNFLKWPESIHLNKTKIVIHHTADDNSAILT